jgi:hypothetical protein
VAVGYSGGGAVLAVILGVGITSITGVYSRAGV